MDYLQLNYNSETLTQDINKAIAQSRVLKDTVDKDSEIRKQYWAKGANPAVISKIHPKKAKTVNNRIFANFLTILPYWINRTPEPTPLADGLKDDQRERLIKGLQAAWEVETDMKQKMQKAALHWLIYHIGVLKMRWNDGIETLNVLPTKIGFDPKATRMGNCDYWWEELEDTAENVAKKFPKKKKEIYKAILGEENRQTKIKYLEFWGNNGEWVAWKFNNILLDKEKNPNFKKTGNLFKKPQFPYLILNDVFNIGEHLYDDVSLIDNAMSLQDSVNKLERQILDLNEGQKRVWIGSGEAISKESFQKIINQTGDFGVYMDRKIPQGGLQLPLAGKPDNSLFNNLEHLLSEIDNAMGVHAALRGQYEPGMSRVGMRGYAMMINQDLAKDLIVSRLEQLAENWFNMYLQFVKVYGGSSVKFNTPTGSITLRQEDIPDGIKIMVKKGSMLPVDRASRAENAVKLAELGLEAPADLYKDLGYGDALERLKNLEEYKQGQVIPTSMTPEGQQLARLKKLITSPEFQKLSDIQKQDIIQQARQVVEAIKGQTQTITQ